MFNQHRLNGQLPAIAVTGLLRRPAILLLLVLACCFPVQVSATDEALKNGVPLVFEFQVQVVKKNTWLWDSVEIEQVLYRQLQYHALSESYQVKDISAASQGNYRRLDDALRAAGNIEKLLLSGRALDSDLNYEIRLRGSLDIESLPTPVRLIAYVSSAWDMTSKWYSWPLVR